MDGQAQAGVVQSVGDRLSQALTGLTDGLVDGADRSARDIDLTVESVSLNPSNPDAGEVTDICATIYNDGSETAESVELLGYVDGQHVATFVTQTVGPGESEPAACTGHHEFEPGTHTVTVEVDPDDHKAETDERNNERSMSVSVEGSYGSVRGQVLGEDGRPVAGARVYFSHPEIGGTRTDDNGEYAFSEVPTGEYDVEIQAGCEYDGDTRPVSVTEGDTAVADFRLNRVTYDIRLDSEPVDAYLSGGGTFGCLEETTIEAPETVDGYEFQEWQADGETFSTDAVETITVNTDRDLTAVYAEPGEPDLELADLEVSPSNPDEGESTTITAAVANTGESRANGADLEVTAGSNVLRHDGIYLDPGDRVTVEFDWRAEEGTDAVEAEIDYNDRIEEEDETNNRAFESVSVANRKPNLVVTDVRPNPSSPEDGDRVEFDVRIENVGEAGAEDFGVRLDVGDETFSQTNLDLGAGDGRTVSLGSWGATPGVDSASAEVDFRDGVDERDESDNTATVDFSVADPQPNLRVTDVEWRPTEPSADEPVEFRATVRNTGDASVGDARVRIAADGSAVDFPATVNVGAGDAVRTGWMGGESFDSGSHDIVAVADPDDRIDETSESDNRHAETLSIDATAGSVSGRMTDDDGEAIAGARVYLDPRTETRTDSQGRYSFSGVDAGEYELEVVAGSCYDNPTRTITVDGGDTVTEDFRLDSQSYTVRLDAEPVDVDARGEGVYDCGSEVDITVPRTSGGYEFSHWETRDGERVRETASFALSYLTDDHDLVAQYKRDGEPDLAVTDITWRPTEPTEGDPVTYTVEIANHGDARATGFDLELFVENDLLRQPDVDLGPGESVAVEFSSWEAVAGTYEADATVDASDTVDESNEGNNERAETVRVAEPAEYAVDLDSEPIAVPLDGGGTYTEGEDAFLSAPEQRDGYEFSHWESRDGARVSTEPTYELEGIDGDYRLTAVYERTGRPDLVVEAVEVRPADPTGDDPVEIRYTVANDGTVAAAESRAVLSVDGDGRDATTVRELEPGEMTTTDWIDVGTLGTGDHEVAVETDVTDEVDERDESDNRRTERVVVSEAVGQIEGTVTDAEGEPIEGAEVTLGGETTVRTNWNGEYAFTEVAVGDRTLEVTADGYESTTRRVTVVAGDTATEEISLGAVTYTVRLDAEPVSVRLDGAGQYEAGEDVSVSAPLTLDGYRFEGWYTADGDFYADERELAIEDIDRSYDLVARYGERERPNLVVSEVDVPSDLREGDSVTLAVEVANTGDRDAERTDLELAVGEETFRETVELAGDGSETYTFEWTATADTRTVSAAVDPEDEIDESDETDNRATRPVEVSQPTATPVEGGTVVVTVDEEDLSRADDFTARVWVDNEAREKRVGADGRTTFEGVPAGEHFLGVESTDGAFDQRFRREVDAGAETTVDVDVPDLLRVEGQVQANGGESVEGVVVEIDGRTATTGSDGMYSFDRFQPDHYVATVYESDARETILWKHEIAFERDDTDRHIVLPQTESELESQDYVTAGVDSIPEELVTGLLLGNTGVKYNFPGAHTEGYAFTSGFKYGVAGKLVEEGESLADLLEVDPMQTVDALVRLGNAFLDEPIGTGAELGEATVEGVKKDAWSVPAGDRRSMNPYDEPKLERWFQNGYDSGYRSMAISLYVVPVSKLAKGSKVSKGLTKLDLNKFTKSLSKVSPNVRGKIKGKIRAYSGKSDVDVSTYLSETGDSGGKLLDQVDEQTGTEILRKYENSDLDPDIIRQYGNGDVDSETMVAAIREIDGLDDPYKQDATELIEKTDDAGLKLIDELGDSNDGALRNVLELDADVGTYLSETGDSGRKVIERLDEDTGAEVIRKYNSGQLDDTDTERLGSLLEGGLKQQQVRRLLDFSFDGSGQLRKNVLRHGDEVGARRVDGYIDDISTARSHDRIENADGLTDEAAEEGASASQIRGQAGEAKRAIHHAERGDNVVVEPGRNDHYDLLVSRDSGTEYVEIKTRSIDGDIDYNYVSDKLSEMKRKQRNARSDSDFDLADTEQVLEINTGSAAADLETAKDAAKQAMNDRANVAADTIRLVADDGTTVVVSSSS
ncbi:putative calcium-binding protein [Halosimplex carlsbadense 2-9-1]|uniref:Putative calcium-binding protein n=1 Tax=Halosimplex carlsbadense 2-9-1 TaxID=797114 RepID=M0D4A1_9EURY|nr:CARDB domain-containing protein [Halosimplex carlsbadense]ELZ29673.1 putative calcium-binding protein [Halosimplex carlsbadense 2-9-1]